MEIPRLSPQTPSREPTTHREQIPGQKSDLVLPAIVAHQVLPQENSHTMTGNTGWGPDHNSPIDILLLSYHQPQGRLWRILAPPHRTSTLRGHKQHPLQSADPLCWLSSAPAPTNSLPYPTHQPRKQYPTARTWQACHCKKVGVRVRVPTHS